MAIPAAALVFGVGTAAGATGGGIYNVCNGTLLLTGGNILLNSPNNIVQAAC